MTHLNPRIPTTGNRDRALAAARRRRNKRYRRNQRAETGCLLTGVVVWGVALVLTIAFWVFVGILVFNLVTTGKF